MPAPVQALPNNGSSAPAPQVAGGQTGGLPNVNPNATSQAPGTLGGNPTPPGSPESTMDASAIQTGQTTPSIQFPATGAPNAGTIAANANATNASIPSTVPSAESIIAQGEQPTEADTTNTDLLTKLATAMGGQTSLATDQANQEATAGVPALTKTVNDLNTQLQGLTDQASTLQLNAGAGGTIENTEQNQAAGRGITAAGLAPLNSADLRNNQIQQASIAAQSLTLKSAIYGAQGQLTLAKSAADQAAQVAFDAETQNINYIKGLIAANTPTMTKEDKAQADLVTSQLQDRQTAITQGINDAKTGQALISAAMAQNPEDPQAQHAASLATQIPLTDPNYLQKVTALVGNYQTDVTQKALTLESTRLDIEQKQQAIAQAADSLPSKQQTVVDKAQTALDSVSSGKNLPQVVTSFSNMLNLASSQDILTNPAAQKNFLTQYALTVMPSGTGLRSILNNTANESSYDSNVWGIMKAAQANIDASGKAELSQDAINELLATAGQNYQSSADTYSQIRDQQVQTLQNEGVQNPDQYLTDYSELNVQGNGTVSMVGPDGQTYPQVPVGQVSAMLKAGGSFPQGTTASQNVQNDVTNNPIKSFLGKELGVPGY